MSIEVAVELWGELRRYVNTVDRNEAADTVVSILIDNDYDADDIRDAFKGDSDIKQALSEYLGNNQELEEEIDDEDDDNDSCHDWDE